MPKASTNVLAMPQQRQALRIASENTAYAYIRIEGDSRVSYGIDDVTRYDARRLLKAALALAEWLREIADE